MENSGYIVLLKFNNKELEIDFEDIKIDYIVVFYNVVVALNRLKKS